jgi:hypothetical protein
MYGVPRGALRSGYKGPASPLRLATNPSTDIVIRAIALAIDPTPQIPLLLFASLGPEAPPGLVASFGERGP